ncbi:cyclic lactone autoinducer peptide [Oscillospiraceae bacterium 21-37]
MAGLWSAIASLIEAIANLGAGAASSGATYEPIVPDELSK